MKNYYSSYKISRLVSDDLWSKVFRFNKNVRLFRQMGISYYYVRRLKAPIRFKAFHAIRSHYKDYSYRKKFIKRFMDRKKFKFFYGYLNNRTFKLMYKKSKGAVSYNPVSYIMGRFEMLFHLLLFRASFFSDTITTYQIVFHGFVGLQGRMVKITDKLDKIAVFVSFSKFFYFPKRIKQRITNKVYIFPSPNLLISEFLPVFMQTRYFRFPDDSKCLFNAAYENVFKSF